MPTEFRLCVVPIDIQLERLRGLLAARHISIELTDGAKTLLVDEGYEPTFGARPLKRVIQHKIADPLAVEILEGLMLDGDHLLVDAVGDALPFTALELVEA